MVYIGMFFAVAILRMHIFRNKFKVFKSMKPPRGVWLFPKELKCQSTVPSNVTWMLQGLGGWVFLLVEQCNKWVGNLRDVATKQHFFMNRSVVRRPGAAQGLFFFYSKPSVFDCKRPKTRWFNVTFLYPSWRSLSLWKGHLTIPKRSLSITWKTLFCWNTHQFHEVPEMGRNWQSIWGGRTFLLSQAKLVRSRFQRSLGL